MTACLLPIAISGLLALYAQAAPAPGAEKSNAAEELPGVIQKQGASREAMQAKAAEAQAALRAWYISALDAVRKDAITKGDLDSVVATDAERDRADRDLTDEEKSKLPAVPRAVRDKYDQARAQQANQLKAAATASLQAYAATLERIEKRLTQLGELDAAIAARMERAKVAAQWTGPAAAAAPASTATAGAARPPASVPAAKTGAPAAAVAKGVTKENPGMVEVEKLGPAKLAEGLLWKSVSPGLVGATIFQGDKTNEPSSAGAAVFKVTAPGRVYLALNYQYQGNRGGDWQGERWMEENFVQSGWERVDGEELVSKFNGERKFIIMTKVLEKDETGRLRCNKYEPPYFITFHP